MKIHDWLLSLNETELAIVFCQSDMNDGCHTCSLQGQEFKKGTQCYENIMSRVEWLNGEYNENESLLNSFSGKREKNENNR